MILIDSVLTSIPARKCSLHHLRILRNEQDQGADITHTPGDSGTGRQIGFDEVVSEVIRCAMKKGINGPYQVKIALDSANMTAGR